VLVHGRDQDHGFMLDVAARAGLDDVTALLLPESAQRSWYAGRYFDPLPALEPAVTEAVAAVEAAVTAAEDAGLDTGRVVLAGFSQGACVVTEVLRRRPRPFGAVVVLTGALIGDPPPSEGLGGQRVHCSFSRHDAWIAEADALAAARYFERAGAEVTVVTTDEREHGVSDDEARALRELLESVTAR
jgi:predicted esterase